MSDGSRGPQLAAVLIFLLALSVVTVGLRCYTMVIILKRFFIEDWLALVALILYCLYTAFGLAGVHYGLGSHVADVSPSDRIQARFWQFMCQALYIVLSVLTKYMVGLFLLRICLHQRWKIITIRCMLGVSTIFGMFLFFLAVFQCHPVAWYWWRYDSNPPFQGDCNAASLATIPSYMAAFINCLVDWTLGLFIPAAVVWTVKMELRVKVSVIAVLALGSIASIATIMRIPYATSLLQNSDYLFNFTNLAIWTTVENGLAITASSLAKLKPLFRRFRWFSTISSGSTSRLYASTEQTRTIGSRGRTSKANKRPSNYLNITPFSITQVDAHSGSLNNDRWRDNMELASEGVEMVVISKGHAGADEPYYIRDKGEV